MTTTIMWMLYQYDRQIFLYQNQNTLVQKDEYDLAIIMSPIQNSKLAEWLP